MKKHYKIGIYGDPAVGKSVFALGWPKPFFICTDSNYEFLEDFGAKEENHVQVHSWSEFKNFVKTFDASKYGTIVIDLIEDLYQWCDAEYCKRNGIEDLGELNYGKGYKIVRQDFAVTLLSLMNKDTNFIILTHAVEETKTNNRGVNFIDYSPSSFLPSKCWELIDGKLRFFFRAHIEEENVNGKFMRKRLLSVSPKPHEFQINRGVNVDSLPDDIDLTYDAFAKTFGLEANSTHTENVTPVEDVKAKAKKVRVKKEEPKQEEPKIEVAVAEPEDIEDFDEAPSEKLEMKPTEKPIQKEAAIVDAQKAEEPKKESGASQLDRIKALLAARKNMMNK